jgi:hypothetical protein
MDMACVKKNAPTAKRFDIGFFWVERLGAMPTIMAAP